MRQLRPRVLRPKKLAPPQTFADLVKPQYKNLLVTENVATSSPGLAFLLGTAATYGDDGWQGYWKKLKANGVEVVDSWEQAYDTASPGPRPARRPRATSRWSSPTPPARPPRWSAPSPQPAQAPAGVATGTCFRQIEFAGLLNGAKNSGAARRSWTSC